MVKDVAVAQTHNVSVNGKSGKTAFNIGLGYLDQDGMNKAAKEDNFKRYNASINLTTEFNKWITLKAGAIYSKREKSYPYNATGVFDPWYYCYRWSDIYPMGTDENGNELRSPASEFSQANTAKMTRNYTNINMGLHLNILKGWTADLIIRMLTKNISGYVPVPVSQQPTLGVAQHHAWMPMAIE